MSREWILKTLMDQGVPRIDVNIYIFLIEEGPNNRKNIADKLNLSRREVCNSLTHLKAIGIVNEIPKCPAMISPLSFDRVLRLFLEIKKKQTKELQERKETLLESWRTLIKEKKVA